jgi:hypothetical protein
MRSTGGAALASQTDRCARWMPTLTTTTPELFDSNSRAGCSLTMLLTRPRSVRPYSYSGAYLGITRQALEPARERTSRVGTDGIQATRKRGQLHEWHG